MQYQRINNHDSAWFTLQGALCAKDTADDSRRDVAETRTVILFATEDWRNKNDVNDRAKRCMTLTVHKS